ARAVVALETTLVAHGFPPGEGVEVGLESERQVRAAGAVPATIGVLGGEIVVGLTESELERFDAGARKIGPRDLASAVAQRAVGATTVGGTLAVAGARRVGGRQVPARRAGDGGGPRVARGSRARLRRRHAAALLRGRGRAVRLGADRDGGRGCADRARALGPRRLRPSRRAPAGRAAGGRRAADRAGAPRSARGGRGGPGGDAVR